MNLFLDCEFNGFNGPLISMALVDECGRSFYEVLPCPHPIQWVENHVMPKLNKAPITHHQFQQQLQLFLGGYDRIHIIADWPEDIVLFLKMLIVAPGSHMRTPPLSMQIWKVPIEQLMQNSTAAHHALSDAQALAINYRRYYQASCDEQ